MQQQLSFKISGYPSAPYEWLRIWAFKRIGKRYTFRLNDHRVISAEALSINERLFCLMMPFTIGFTISLLLAGMWMLTFVLGQFTRTLPDYLWDAPLWHHLLHVSWIALLSYTFIFSCGDVIAAYQLIRRQQRN